MAADLSALSGAVIAFDLDGTLVDTAPDLIGTLNHLLTQEGLPALPLDQARPFIGHGARRLLQRGFIAAGAHLDPQREQALFDRFIPHYLARIAEESRPFPGCLETLQALRAAGARLSVCTNKPTSLSVALLEALQMSDFFAAVIGADSAPAPKPDPRHLQAAIQAAGGGLGRALLVGDSATDFAAARNAGAPVVLVSFGYTDIPVRELSPDAAIDDYAELPRACARLLAACGG